MNKEGLFLYFDRAITACLCLLIFCLPFAKSGVGIFTGLAAFLWILKRVLGYRANGGLWGMIPKTELNKALGIFLIINAISVIFSVDHGLSFHGFFCKELKFIVIYFMVVEVINGEKRLRHILITIIASAVLITSDAFVQYFKGTDFLRGYTMHYFHNWARSTASFSNPNGFAGWLIVIIPLLLALLVSVIIKTKIAKFLLSILIALMFVCLLMTYTRGAWLSFIVGIFFIVCYVSTNFVAKNKKLSLIIIGMVFLATFLSFLQPVKTKVQAIGKINFSDGRTLHERIKSMTEKDYVTNWVRFNLWKESLEIIKDYPWSGCGLNTYSIVVKDYKSFESGGGYPHNSYLQKIAETGPAGLLAFFFIVFSFLKVNLIHISRSANKNNALVVGLLAGIVSFLIQSFFDNNLYALQLVVLFWFMLGLTIAVIKLEKASLQQQT